MMNVETINKAELNTDKLKSFLIDEIKRTLKAAFDEKSNSDKIKDDFSLKIGKAIADGIDEWIKGAVKPTEIDASGIEDSVKGIQKEIVEYVERRWNDVTQTMQMLQNSMLGFSEGINPITIQTMQIAVGDESLQFRFVDSKVNPKTVDHIVTYNGQDKTLTAAQGIIQHMTMGITEIKAVHTDDEYMFWDVRGFTSHVLESTKPYYLYIRADKTSSDADFVLSEIAIPLEWSVGYYHFLTGILNSEYENTRAFVSLYGFTEILPGRITTNKIVSQDGKTYFDLLNSVIGGKIKFLSGTEEKDLDLWATEIEDMAGAMLLDIEELNNLIEDFESYIDNAFRDGIIEEAEAKAIEKYINSIINEKSSLEATYNKLYMNPLLTGDPKDFLLHAKITYFGMVTDLIDLINLVIADGKVTSTEKQQVDTVFGFYSTDRATFATRIEEANASIQQYLKGESDGARAAAAAAEAAANAASQDVNDLSDIINNLDEYIDDAFRDGIIEEAEAKAIETYINQINSEKASLEATYNKLYVNPYLSGDPKDFLLHAKITYFGTVDNLISSINAVIADGKVTPSEKQSVDAIFVTYRTDKAAFSTRIEEANKSIQDYLKSNADTIDAKVNIAKAITDKFGTTINGGLVQTVIMLLREAGSVEDTAGISGIQGAAKDDPAFWAGGTYDQAFGGTAKAIIRHDGSGHLAGGNIKWNIAGNTEFLGGIKSPFTDISSATIEEFWEEEITSWANNFFENQYTTSLVVRIIPCRNLLNGQVFRIHALQRGILLQPEEYNGFYENGTLLNEIQLNKGDAIEMVCICYDNVFHSWDIVRRYKCRPYDL